MNEDFGEVIEALQAMLVARESTMLGDEPGPKLGILPKLSLPFSAFNTVTDEYNQAIGNSIIHLRRYERTLLAWCQVIDGLSVSAREAVSVDYIAPTLHMACDFPLIIKNQIVHGAVKLIVLLDNGDCIAELEGHKQDNYWFDKLSALVPKDGKGAALHEAISKLWDTESAKQLRAWHGRAHHDVERPLIGEKPFVETIGPGCTVTGFEPPLELMPELALIDEQRINADSAYAVLASYIESLV